jgi:uncharacterized hydantoinase/oxoprolinase family protein
MLDDTAIDGIAAALSSAQVDSVAGALQGIQRRFPEITVAVVTGLGDFIASEAARAAGLTVIPLADRLGETARTAPAAAVAYLLSESLETHR